jgi:GDP-4-dehydro-6-deoxy-D-mannose reductase
VTIVALVTGVTGFAGGHLAEALLARGEVEVHGLSRRGQWPGEWRRLADRVQLCACDLCDRACLERVLREVRPAQIYHLAGYPHVSRSLQEPELAWTGNLTATRTLYESVAACGLEPRILYVGSGQVYGEPPTADAILDETCLFYPGTPYAAAKAAADLASYQYTRTHGLDIVRARPFNHVGPRQSAQFAVAHFAEQIARIEAGKQPPLLETGNLSPERDLTDVRDTVRAYVRLLEGGRTGEAYNVCTGRTQSMQDVLDRLLRLTRVAVEVRQRQELVRPRDPAALRASSDKLRRETGWTPAFSLDQTLSDMLEYWRKVTLE